MVTIFLSCVAKFKSALRTVLPAVKLGVIVEGERVSKVIISLAACRMKSSSLISGKGMLVGKMQLYHNMVVFLCAESNILHIYSGA